MFFTKTLSAVKKVTGITGLPAIVNSEQHLRIVYNKILRALQKIPPDAAYRKYTEQLVKSRLEIVNSSINYLEIEEKINCGQIEELIWQGENELLLARKFISVKPWESLIEEPPPNQWAWPPAV